VGADGLGRVVGVVRDGFPWWEDFFLEGLDFLQGWFEEELGLVDGADLFHPFLCVVPETDWIFILTLEPLHSTISIVQTEILIPSAEI